MQLQPPKKKTQISFIIHNEKETKHRSFVNSLQFDPNCSQLYTAGSDSIIRRWDVKTANRSDRFIQSMDHHCDWVNDIVLCGNGNCLLSASSDTTIKVWNAKSGACLSTLRTHKDSVRCLAYASGLNEIVASAGLDRLIYLWDVNTLTKLTAHNTLITTSSLRGAKSSIYSLAMSKDGNVIISGSAENVLRIWDPRIYVKVAKLRGHSDNIRSININRDGTMCLSASSDGTVRLWSIGQQRCIASIRCHTDSVWAIQTDPLFSYVVSGGRDKKIFVTALKNIHNSKLLCIEEKPIQKLLLVDSTGNDCPTHVWAATWSSTIRRWPLNNSNHYTSVENVPNEKEKLVYKNDKINLTLQKPKEVDPDMLLKGAPSIRKYVILNDKRHVVTKDSEENIQMWDVLQARLVKNFGSKVTLEDIVRDNFRRIFVPSWFGVDIKCGVLEITLDESDVFSAWVSAKDGNFVNKPGDAKINYGGMMLKSLFERWPLSYVDNEEESPLYGFFSIPLHTPILLWNYCDDLARPVFRCMVGDLTNPETKKILQDHIPGWVLDVVQHNQFPKFNKIPFILQPHLTYSTKTIKKDRLSATEMLLVRKVMEHVYEKILYPNNNDNLESSENSSIHNTSNCNNSNKSISPAPLTSFISSQIPQNIEERMELYCIDQKLDPEMDLRTVKHFIWKQGGDLVIHYKPI